MGIRVCQYCPILTVWVLGFGDVVVPAFSDAIAAEQSTRFAACEIVLGFSVAWLSTAPRNVCTDFSNPASSQVSPISFVNGVALRFLFS